MNAYRPLASDDDLDLIFEALSTLPDREFIEFLKWWNE